MAIRFRDYIKDVEKYVERQERLITSMRENNDLRRSVQETDGSARGYGFDDYSE